MRGFVSVVSSPVCLTKGCLLCVLVIFAALPRGRLVTGRFYRTVIRNRCAFRRLAGGKKKRGRAIELPAIPLSPNCARESSIPPGLFQAPFFFCIRIDDRRHAGSLWSPSFFPIVESATRLSRFGTSSLFCSARFHAVEQSSSPPPPFPVALFGSFLTLSSSTLLFLGTLADGDGSPPSKIEFL